MAVDERYQDNLVVTKDAFQNLLTNIKNYPIIDIDYVTETDTDELHGDTIWPHYTAGMPCIKITYGDDRTTKGNIIFAEEQRVLINKYKKILNQLRVQQNEYERLVNRWKKIYELNHEIYEEKSNQINRFFSRFATIDVNKLAFLKAGWNLLQYNLVDLFNPEIGDTRTQLLRTSNPESFAYQEFLGPDNFDYKKALLPQNGNNAVMNNLEYIILNEEQKAKIVTTLQLLRDLLIDEENETYFFNDSERNTINSFINFIASYNYFAVLDTVGLAGYEYTSDQILVIKQGKVQINDSNRVATFEPIGSSATYNTSTNYYSPEYYSIYVNIGNSDYNSNETYYLLHDLTYSEYTYTTETDFNSKRNLLFTKQDNLFCYRLLNDVNAENFEARKNNLYIQTSNGELIQQAVREILPQIVDDLVWTRLDNINLSFDSMYFDFRANIQSIITTLNNVVGPRLTYILTKLDEYINILEATSFIVTANGNVSTTTSADEENVYQISPTSVTADEVSNHVLDAISAIKFKIIFINKLIADCNQLIQDIAAGKKNSAGQDIDDGENRVLYGYKYVKVGSNITYDDTYYYSSSPWAVGAGQTAEKLEKTDTAENQASGTYRITINGHIYEVPIKGFTNTASNQRIYITTKNDDGITITSRNGTSLKPIILDGNVEDKGTLKVLGTSNLQGNVTLGTTGTDAAASNLLPSKNNGGTLGSTSAYWANLYVTTIGDSSHSIPTAYIDNLMPLDSGDSGTGTNIGSSSSYWTNAYITNINSHDSDNKAVPTGSTVAGDTGYFNNIYINGNEIDTTDLDDVVNGTTGTTATFWRGDASWSNELTGSLTTAGLTSSGVVNITNSTAASSKTTGALKVTGGIGCQGYIYGDKVYGAVFNDYAEYRTTINLEAGRVVIDNDDGSLSCSSSRLQPGAQVISDTFGYSMGETDVAKTPLAVAGRVLVYTYQPRENYHAGMAVCSAPGGTVDIMTREEIRDYPDCIIGIVSEIPQYETWSSDNVAVNGRIWIKVR